MSNVYQGDDRVKQVDHIRRIADVMTYYESGTADERVAYWMSGDPELPDWWDEADTILLVRFTDDMI